MSISSLGSEGRGSSFFTPTAEQGTKRRTNYARRHCVFAVFPQIRLSPTGRPESVAVSPVSGGVAELERLETALRGLRTGVAELEQSPSYLMLADAKPSTTTAAQFATAVRQAKDLWPLVLGCEERLAEARAFVDQHKLTKLSNDRRRLGELATLLSLPVVVNLIDGPAGPLTVNAAVATLHQRYDAVHAGVARIDDAWLNVLPRVEAARETVERLGRDAEALGVTEPLIGRARAQAEDLAERLLSDPISVQPEDGPALDQLVADAARQITKLQTEHDNLDEDLADTKELLASLRVLRNRAEVAATEARQKIVTPDDLVTVPSNAILDGSGGLADQLDELFALARGDGAGSGRAWTQQRSVLDRWLSRAQRLQEQLLSAERRNRADLERREELRGRLHAFQAKMAATGQSEEQGPMGLVDLAWNELYTAPTDLDNAESVIAELALELRKTN